MSLAQGFLPGDLMKEIKSMGERYDLVIVGGGVTGSGVFCEAVQQGFFPLLVEANDFVWGTSSRSSKMVHGGLRYLKEGKFLLTWSAVRERQRLAGVAGSLRPAGSEKSIGEKAG